MSICARFARSCCRWRHDRFTREGDECKCCGLLDTLYCRMPIDYAMSLFQWERVALMLAAIFTVVVPAEPVVTFIRKRII